MAGSLPVIKTGSYCRGITRTMPPTQSNTRNQDSQALWQKGLVQPTGICVTLIRGLCLSELHFPVCKIRAMPSPHVKRSTQAGTRQEPSTQGRVPPSASLLGPSCLPLSGHTSAAHVPSLSGCHHYASGTDELLLMGFRGRG